MLTWPRDLVKFIFTINHEKRDDLSRDQFLLPIFIYLAPLEKLINSDRLTYLPNLYYRQYKHIEALNHQRFDYPQQKILIPRPTTRLDFLLVEAKKAQFKLSEDLKYKKAICYELAKSAKDEFTKKQLKKEEKHLFQRVAFSQLAEAVKKKVLESANDVIVKLNDKAPEALIKKVEKTRKVNNDIFIDKSDSGHESEPGQNILDDIFNERPPPKIEQKEYLTTVHDYLIRLAKLDPQGIRQHQRHINRRLCFKKINENLRKRIKNKNSTDETERNLNSATVCITNLINLQAETKNEEEMIDIPSCTDYLASSQTKSKKKKQDSFDLKWNEEASEEFSRKNNKFDISKGKFDPVYLSLSMENNEKEYETIFEKNIQGNITFPPSLANIPSLDDKFEKGKQYYNSLADQDYQSFISEHNRRAIFEKFKEISPYVLSESYDNDNENSNLNMAQLFLNSEGPCSDRVIYKITNNKVSASTIQKRVSLTKDELCQLSFFVRKYLCLFGNNWKLISLFTSIHPGFSKMCLSTEKIEELQQIPKQKGNNSSLSALELLDSKILPFSVTNSTSSERTQINSKLSVMDQEITEENVESQQQQFQFDFSLYQKQIEENLKDHETMKQYAYSNMATGFKNFAENVTFSLETEPKQQSTDYIDSIVKQFETSDKQITIDSKEVAKMTWCFDWVLERVKSQIKFASPIRKRKNINDKSSELVKILHTLRQRQQNPVVMKPTLPSSASVPRPTIIPSSQPVSSPVEQQPQRKMLPKPKTQDADKKGPASKHGRSKKKKDGKDDDTK